MIEYIPDGGFGQRYEWKGRPVPSVTEILEEAGYYDFTYVDAVTLEHARQVGDAVHERIHRHHADGVPLLAQDIELDAYLLGYRRALQFLDLEILATEVVMGCSWFGGTLDTYGRLDGLPSVLDVKTTTKLNREAVELQTAAYRWLAERHFERPIRERYALHLPGDGWFRLEPLADPLAETRFFALTVNR